MPQCCETHWQKCIRTLPPFKTIDYAWREEVEQQAFFECDVIEHIECKNLEIIGEDAFTCCKSLSSIDLPSAKIVKGAFTGCKVLTDVKFGKNLDNLGAGAFGNCTSLERIIIPLTIGLFGNDTVFAKCDNLKRVDLVEDVIIHKVVDALFMEEWRQDMRNEIGSINQILPNTPAGNFSINCNVWRRTRAIREWIQRVLRKIHHYKAQHRSLLNEAATHFNSIFQAILFKIACYLFLNCHHICFLGKM